MRVISVFVVLAALLSGCVVPFPKIEPLQLDQRPVAGQGHVLLHVVGARPPKWTEVNLNRVGGSGGAKLGDLIHPYSPELYRRGTQRSVFFARLPAGEYEILNVHRGSPYPDIISVLVFSATQQFGRGGFRFKVEPGALTNLGTLVVSAPVDKNPGTARLELIGGELGRAGARGALEALSSGPLTIGEAGAWLSPSNAQDERPARERAGAIISTLSDGHDDLAGRPLGGNGVGQILLREADGHWRAENLDALVKLTYARRMRDGTLIAGSDLGRYYVRRPGGAWQSHSLGIADSLVLHVEPLADGRGAIMVALSGHEALALHVPQFGAPPVTIHKIGGLMPTRGSIVSTPRSLLVVSIPNLGSSTADLLWVSKSELKVNAQREASGIWGMQHLPGGELIMRRVAGRTSKMSLSRDDGRTWEHRTGAGPAISFMVDATRGYGLDWSPGAFSVESFLVKTSDGGQTWTRTGARFKSEVAGEIVWASPEGEVVVSVGGEMLSTRDDGKTWKRELPRLSD